MQPISTLWRELRTIRTLVAAKRRMGRYRLDGQVTVADVVEDWADRTPGAAAIRWGDDTWSYADLDTAANRVANWALAQGLGRGDVVALLMENRPEFIATWLGLVKVGAQAALINTGLRGAPLVHAIRVSGARVMILGAELAASYETARSELCAAAEGSTEAKRLAEAERLEGPVVWAAGGEVAGCEDLDARLARAATGRPPDSCRSGMTARENLFFIYTSGTTGNPKAAYFSHHRFLEVGAAYTALASLRADDNVYCVLPLYHTAGGVIACSMAMVNGATLVLRRRFSATTFWKDCRDYDVTIFQYIGELCRYLLNQPDGVHDASHRVRCAVGNGLRPDIWERFQSRFAIPQILEFYGATEGNFGIVNIDNKVGAVGRIPPYAGRLFPVKLIRFDVETETHVRGSDGFCIQCGIDEAGEAVGRIPNDDSDPVGRFEGYRDREASEKKILRDVFEKGDAWYRTGDLLSRDASGYFYFVDRIGDTFRWKGENIATSQVAEVLSVYDGVREANVYGVRVPGADGRAGMAALVADEGVDLTGLYDHLQRELASYAQPLFLRLRPQMDTTGTFKHRKVDLVEQGFDPGAVAEPLYFRDDEQGRFLALDADLHRRICAGDVRV